MEIIINKQKINNNSLLNEEVLQTEKESIFFNEVTKSKELSLRELKYFLENNQVLNYPYDFLSLDGSKNIVPALIKINLVDNINIKNSEVLFEHYNRENGEITITEKLYLVSMLYP